MSASAPASPIQSISELILRPDFPECAIGQQIDIGGLTGVAFEVVKQSLKVRSSQGGTKSYNINVLRKLYGPRLISEPLEASDNPAPEAARAPESQREIIAEPDFTAPVKQIEELVSRADFPKCAFGEHLDLHGYTGVVVEIANRSLKVRSREGATRSYNADGLRRIYGKPAGSSPSSPPA